MLTSNSRTGLLLRGFPLTLSSVPALISTYTFVLDSLEPGCQNIYSPALVKGQSKYLQVKHGLVLLRTGLQVPEPGTG